MGESEEYSRYSILDAACCALGKSEEEIRRISTELSFSPVAHSEFVEQVSTFSFEELASYYKESEAWFHIMLNTVGLAFAGAEEGVELFHEYSLLRRTVELSLHNGGSWCLDYGCGSGCAGMIAHHVGMNVVFSDVKTPFLAVLEKFFELNHWERVLVTTIREEFPVYLQGLFDVIICRDVLEHVPHPVETLSNLMAQLRPGGYMFLSVWFYDNEGEAPYHLNTETSQYLRDLQNWYPLLENIGLQLVLNDDNGSPKVYQKVEC